MERRLIRLPFKGEGMQQKVLEDVKVGETKEFETLLTQASMKFCVSEIFTVMFFINIISQGSLLCSYALILHLVFLNWFSNPLYSYTGDSTLYS